MQKCKSGVQFFTIYFVYDYSRESAALTIKMCVKRCEWNSRPLKTTVQYM